MMSTASGLPDEQRDHLATTLLWSLREDAESFAEHIGAFLDGGKGAPMLADVRGKFQGMVRTGEVLDSLGVARDWSPEEDHYRRATAALNLARYDRLPPDEQDRIYRAFHSTVQLYDAPSCKDESLRRTDLIEIDDDLRPYLGDVDPGPLPAALVLGLATSAVEGIAAALREASTADGAAARIVDLAQVVSRLIVLIGTARRHVTWDAEMAATSEKAA